MLSFTSLDKQEVQGCCRLSVQLYCGKKSDMGRVIGRLRRVYQTSRTEAVPQIEEVTGEAVTALSSAAPSEADSTEAMDTKGKLG